MYIQKGCNLLSVVCREYTIDVSLHTQYIRYYNMHRKSLLSAAFIRKHSVLFFLLYARPNSLTKQGYGRLYTSVLSERNVDERHLCRYISILTVIVRLTARPWYGDIICFDLFVIKLPLTVWEKIICFIQTKKFCSILNARTFVNWDIMSLIYILEVFIWQLQQVCAIYSAENVNF